MRAFVNEDQEGAVPAWLASSAAIAWRVIVVAIALYGVYLAFGRLHLVVLPVVLALFGSTILVPPANWLRRHGWPPLAATWAVFLGGLLVVAAVVAARAPGAASDFHSLGHQMGRAGNQAEDWLANGPFHLSRAQIQADVASIRRQINANRDALVKGAIAGVTLLAQAVGAAILTLVLTFFFVKDGSKISTWALDLVSESRANDARAIGRKAWEVLGGYIRGTAINGLVNATVLAVGLWILGVPLVVPIALLTFVGGFLPLVGAIISGALAAGVALASKGVVAALVVVGLTVVIHHLEGYLVGPFVLGRAVRLHPVAVLLVLSVGTILGGVLGAFLAVPTTSVLLAIHEYYRQKRRRELFVAAENGNRAAAPTAQMPGPVRELRE
jgi:predicted PurR-regulated permease PerM